MKKSTQHGYELDDIQVRLFRHATGEEIHIVELHERSGAYCGKVEVLTCCGPTLALFHALEQMANDNIIPEAERVGEEIDHLGFLVEGLSKTSQPQPCRELQLMNGDDVSFRV